MYFFSEKHGTFLSHGWKPEVNTSHVRTVVSQIYKLIVSMVKRYLTMYTKCGNVKTSQVGKQLPLVIRGAKASRAKAP